MRNDSKPFNDFKSRSTVYEFIRYAEVMRVDTFKHTCDIRYLDAENYGTDVPFLNSYFVGGQGGGMPEVGSFCAVFYTKQSKDRGYPLILGFIPRSLFFSYDFEPIYVKPDMPDPSVDLHHRKRLKNWKLYPGDFWFSSAAGADLRLDEVVFLQDSGMDEILMDPFTQSINFLSYNQTFNTKAGKMNFGFIHRNDLLGSDARSAFEDASQFLSDGRRIFRVSDAPKTLQSPYGVNKLSDPGINGYNEFRIDVLHFADPHIDVTEENAHGQNLRPLTKSSGNDEDGRVHQPVISLVMGTLVGNDSVSKEGKSRYGKILYPVTFADKYTRTPAGIIGEERPVENQNGVDGEKKMAGAFQVKLPNTRTSFNFTKEGVLEFTLDKSSSLHPNGAGRSANIGMFGSLKMQLGKQASDGKSLLLDCLGGAELFFGGETSQNRSLNMLLTNGFNLEIQGADSDRLSFRARIKNNVDMIISGNKWIQVDGDDIQHTKGKVEQKIEGKLVQNIINDHNKNVGGSYKETITQTYQSAIGLGRSTTIASSNLLNGDTFADKLKILLGDKELMMLLGDYKEEILVGDHTEDILIGDKETTIGIGNFKLDVELGDITAQASLGDISIGTDIGDMDLYAINITATALAKIDLLAPKVKVGNLTQGGVVNSGPLGHRDYLTGLLLKGSQSVTCNTI